MLIKQISNGLSSATINPQGGFLQTWHHGASNRNLIHFSTALPAKASHPCGPVFGFNALAGQPADGRYLVGGKEYKLPRHGFFRDRAWQDIPGTTVTALLRQGNVRGAGFNQKIFDEQYPFEYLANLAISLPDPNRLNWQLAFTNKSTDGSVAPFDGANHLYLPWEEGFGIEELTGLPYGDFTGPNEVRGRLDDPTVLGRMSHKDWQFDLDNPEGTFKNRFTLRYPKSGYSLIMEMAAAFSVKKLLFWHDPKVVAQMGPYACVEPVFCGRDSFRKGLAHMVKPEETVTLEFSLEYREGI